MTVRQQKVTGTFQKKCNPQKTFLNKLFGALYSNTLTVSLVDGQSVIEKGAKETNN